MTREFGREGGVVRATFIGFRKRNSDVEDCSIHRVLILPDWATPIPLAAEYPTLPVAGNLSGFLGLTTAQEIQSTEGIIPLMSDDLDCR